MEVKNLYKRCVVYIVNLMVERVSSEISILYGFYCISVLFYNFGYSVMIIRKVYWELY